MNLWIAAALAAVVGIIAWAWKPRDLRQEYQEYKRVHRSMRKS